MAVDNPQSPGGMGFIDQLKSYNKTFWLANLMEMIERWAYYGVRLVLALYIVGATGQGGLEFNHIQKGNIYLWWAIIASFLPMFTGGFADRYGYKKTIAIAVAMKIGGYGLMATQKEYWAFFAGCMLLAAGTGLFKPGVQGLLAHNVTNKTASVGWGIFYELVNFGAFLGGLMAGPLREQFGWGAVFYFNTALVALNFLPLLMFKEPQVDRTKPLGSLVKAWDDARNEIRANFVAYFPRMMHGFWHAYYRFLDNFIISRLFKKVETFALGLVDRCPAFVREPSIILVNSMKDITQPRLLVFIVISAGFWFAFHQLFDLLPNFLDDWTLAATLPDMFKMENGAVAPEKVLNLNSGLIILGMVPLAYVASKFRALTAINLGIFASIVGILLAGLTQNGWFAIAGILVFTIGEMLSSPRTNDYLASIAPADKKGLYLGYANVPSGIGWALGSVFAGNVYEHHGDKVNFARHYLEHQGGMSAEAVKAIPKEKVMETFAAKVNMGVPEATTMLWNMHHPENIWWIFAGIGMVSLIGMMIYNAVLTKKEAAEAELHSRVPAADVPVAKEVS